MNRIFQLVLGVAALATLFGGSKAVAQNTNTKFQISFPATLDKGPIDGRLLLLISTKTDGEPRFQINEDLNTQQVFGVDVDGWKPGETKVVDQSAFGYPRRSLANIPPGEYTVIGWHERIRPVQRTVHVAAGQTTRVDFDIPLPSGGDPAAH